MKRVLLFVLMFVCASVSAGVPRKIESVYDLHYGGSRIGEVKESFTRDDQQYAIESVARALGPLALVLPGPLMLSSKGQVTPDGLRPLTFSSRQGKNEKKAYLAEFHWNDGTLTLHKHDKDEQHELHPKTMDTLTLIYHFLFNPPVANTEKKFYLTTGKKVRPYGYRVVGDETIKTPLGSINAVHISKLATEDGDSSYDVWVDKDRHFVPVRVVAIDDEGRTVEQVLKSITIN